MHVHAAERTPDEWFKLVTELERQSAKIGNHEDQRFIRKMINELTASDDAVPAQALLSIKAELERRR